MKSKKKDNRGGAGRGQGRKSGDKAFVNVAKKEPTIVMRVPVSLKSTVQKLIAGKQPL